MEWFFTIYMSIGVIMTWWLLLEYVKAGKRETIELIILYILGTMFGWLFTPVGYLMYVVLKQMETS